MGVTISTHNGSVVAREHNVRNRKVTDKEAHIDPQGKHEIWKDEKPRDAYRRIFGEAVEEYNAKQKRDDRKITDYYNAVCKDKKKHAVYEMIIGIYGKTEDGQSICTTAQGKQIMREFVDGWQARNPHLELIGAYYHADEEGEPHVHIDYVPVAEGYTRGLTTQSALVRALEQQGYSKDGKRTAQIQWQAAENAYLTRLCEQAGLQVDHPKAGQKHIETDNYKLQQEKNSLETQINALQGQLLTAEQVKALSPKKNAYRSRQGHILR